MFVRHYEKQTKRELAQRYYTCQRCDAHGEVAFFSQGTSGWVEDSVWAAGDVHTRAQDAAERDLMVDADRVLGLVVCPTCKRRAPGAVGWAWTRVAAWMALGVAVPLVASEALLALPIAAGFAGWQAWRERGRFRRARGAVILKLQPGQLPPPPPAVRPAPLAPPPDLPRARAITAPVPRELPVDPASGPRFLVEK